MAQTKRTDIVVVDVVNEGTSFSTAGRIATAIMEISKKNGACMPQDLNAQGFTPREVADHWNAAHFLIAINNLGGWGKENGKD